MTPNYNTCEKHGYALEFIIERKDKSSKLACKVCILEKFQTRSIYLENVVLIDNSYLELKS